MVACAVMVTSTTGGRAVTRRPVVTLLNILMILATLEQEHDKQTKNLLACVQANHHTCR